MMGVEAVAAAKTTPVPGGGVTVRAAVPGDAEDLGRMFSRCSTETIYLRFRSPYPRVPRTILDRMADVGSHFGKAFVAEINGEVIGHAMYAREHEGDLEADTAVVVEDAWASRGVGWRLFARIREEARRDGVETLLCTTLGDNYRVTDALRRAFPASRITFSGGACHIRLPLIAKHASLR
jgi:GNAT superfamily N-acetyltransferase